MNTLAQCCADCTAPSTFPASLAATKLAAIAQVLILAIVLVSSYNTSSARLVQQPTHCSSYAIDRNTYLYVISYKVIAVSTTVCVCSVECHGWEYVYNSADPQWVSINRGVLICNECCSVHRSLGRYVSHVRSIRAPNWPPVQREVSCECVSVCACLFLRIGYSINTV